MAAPAVHDGRYAIDIRVFLAIITLTMTASFLCGVTMVPLNTTSTRDDTTQTIQAGGLLEGDHTADEHRPSGQHLLVDIRNVDGDFLNSEERLSQAMVDTVREAG